MMGLNYIALRRMKVSGEYRNPGDLVPEAASWRTLNSHLSRGNLAPVSDKDVDDELAKMVAQRRYAQAAAVEAQAPEAEEKPEAEDAPQAEEAQPEEQPEAESQDEEPEANVLDEFHVGGGWYDIPGAEKKLRKDEAQAFLDEHGEDVTTEASDEEE